MLHQFNRRVFNMNVIIRADANQNIGMGHIMRCLSIADAFFKAGHSISFLIADDGASNLIRQRGYEVCLLGSDYRYMDAELNLWPNTDEVNLIIIDSYHVTASYCNHLKERINRTGGKLVYIDDLATFPYPADTLVNYNAYGSSIDYHDLYLSSGIPEPRLILGPAYAPLRAMFRDVEKKTQPETVQNVLISTGGADSEHIALSIARARPSNYTYHFLVGALNRDKDEIRELVADQEHIVIHENVSDMKSLIANMDIAVSAAGSTLYEICACGVPLITYILADNQIRGAEAFDKIGLGTNIGDMRIAADPATEILEAVNELAMDYERRVTAGTRMQEMIDGYGADHLVKEILRNL